MRNTNIMGPRLHFPIYSRWSNRHRPSKFIPRHCSSRHILCRSPFPLCPINRSSIRHYSRICSLIPTTYRIYTTFRLNKSPIPSYIHRSKHNLFPPTFPRACRYTTTLLRLPRRIHFMKRSLLYWILNLPSSRHHIPIYYLRSICLKTRNSLH